MHSSGHAQGSNDTHDDSVALLLDVLTKGYSNKHGRTDGGTERETVEHTCGCRFSLCYKQTDVKKILGTALASAELP